MIYVFLATGFEDIEAIAPVDIMRRLGLTVTTVSVTGERVVTSAHGVGIVADKLFEEVNLDKAELLVLPGGMPGATNLYECEPLRKAIMKHYQEEKMLAAICAAPLVFGRMGILKDVQVTCYPGFESELEGAKCSGSILEEDALFLTAKGPGAALEFGFALAELFADQREVERLRRSMIYSELLCE